MNSCEYDDYGKKFMDDILEEKPKKTYETPQGGWTINNCMDDW